MQKMQKQELKVVCNISLFIFPAVLKPEMESNCNTYNEATLVHF